MPSAHSMTQSVARIVTAAALAACALSANAAFTVYTDEASFLSAISAAQTDTFDDVALGEITGPLDRSTASYRYAASSQDGVNGSFYGLDSGYGGSGPGVWLSQVNSSPIVFDGFGGEVSAIGGYFFATDAGGAYVALEPLTVTAADQFGTITETLFDASPSRFLGFVSTGNLSSLSFGLVDNGANFTTVDNVTLGQIAPVPEPSTYALMLAGLGVVAAVARRRRQA